MIKTAHLRVYLPSDRVGSLPEAERGGARVPHDMTYAIGAISMSDDALAADWHGRRYLCPRTPRLRMLEGVLAVSNAYDRLGTGSVVPERVAGAAKAELERIHEEAPAARTHILTSAWHVPMRWFVPFVTSHREIVGDGPGLRVRYRCDQRQAMSNLDWAVSALHGVDLLDHVMLEVRELRRWLGDFPTSSMVELDYGSVAQMFDESDLVLDDSVAEVKAALDALQRGTVASAIRHYHRVSSRWAPGLAISSSN